MKPIRFSHEYPKLWKQETAQLIALRIMDATDIHRDLREYDTLYREKGMIHYYPLPREGKLIQLIFLGDKGIPFCTIRPYTEKKFEYYSELVNQVLEVEASCREKKTSDVDAGNDV